MKAQQRGIALACLVNQNFKRQNFTPMRKTITKLTVFTFFLFSASSVFSQGLLERAKKADKIYVEQLKFADYIALEMGRWDNEPDWVYTEEGNLGWEYAIGKETEKKTIKIMGIFPVDKKEAINQKVLDRCKALFGDNVELWPEDKFRADDNDVKEKGVDAKFYVVFRRGAWLEPILVDKASEGMGRKFYFNDRTEGLTLTMYEVKKPGKAGKKVVKVDVSLYDALKETEMVVSDVGPIEPGLIDSLLDDFYKIFAEQVDVLLDKFEAEVKAED